MSSDDTRERVRALEVTIQAHEQRMSRFELYCKETQQIYRESFTDLNDRIERFLNHKVHELEVEIESVKKAKRQPLSLLDWTKITLAIISATTAIIVALIGAGII